MAVVTLGCDMYSCSAARVKLFRLLTVRKYSSCLSSLPAPQHNNAISAANDSIARLAGGNNGVRAKVALPQDSLCE